MKDKPVTWKICIAMARAKPGPCGDTGSRRGALPARDSLHGIAAWVPIPEHQEVEVIMKDGVIYKNTLD